MSTVERLREFVATMVAEDGVGREVRSAGPWWNNRIALGINDFDRTIGALSGIVGKRLTYRHSLAAGA